MDYRFIKIELFLLHLKEHFLGVDLVYWNPICGFYFLEGSLLEKCGTRANLKYS